MDDLHPVHCIDADMLIEEVKSRPMLYTKEAAKFGDTNLKRDLWEEVATKLFESEWQKLTNEEKAMRIDLANRRWRNIRACFTREIRRQKDPKWIHGVAYKRRKYLYYNELLFLKNELDQTEADEDGAQDIDVPENNGGDTIVIIDDNKEKSPIPDPVPAPSISMMASMKAMKTKTKSPEINKIKANNVNSTNFALSLVPILNSLPMDKRIDAQIEILSVLKQHYRDDAKGPRAEKTYGKRKAVDVSIEIKRENESEDDEQIVIND